MNGGARQPARAFRVARLLLAVPTNDGGAVASSISTDTMEKDVLIINDPSKYAFFGWYHPTQFSEIILDLLNRTISWASSNSNPNQTRIVLFSEPDDTYAAFVYDWLVSGGYLTENIVNHTSADIEEFPSDYYSDFDLVIYWNTYGYDASNVINSEIPFITREKTIVNRKQLTE